MRVIRPDTWAIDTEASALLVNDEEMELLRRLSELFSQNREMFEAVIDLLHDAVGSPVPSSSHTRLQDVLTRDGSAGSSPPRQPVQCGALM